MICCLLYRLLVEMLAALQQMLSLLTAMVKSTLPFLLEQDLLMQLTRQWTSLLRFLMKLKTLIMFVSCPTTSRIHNLSFIYAEGIKIFTPLTRQVHAGNSISNLD